MNYDELVYANLALGIGLMTNNSEEGLDAVGKMAQSGAHIRCELPKDMSPNKESFETVGFVFEDIGDDILYKATLPEGWRLKYTDSGCSDIIDDKGRKRGASFYKGAFYDRCGNMRLRQRYIAGYEHINPENYKSPITVFVSDFDGKILFTAGKCAHPYCEEYKKLKKECENFLNELYPEWKDVTKYWN